MVSTNTKFKKILILERHEPFRESLIEVLKLEGYIVHHAENGHLGIKSAKEQLPDLILCASAFSDISCWEVFQELRRKKSTRYIPFICISSRPISDECNDLSERVTILTKPFSPEELIISIQKYLSPSLQLETY